MSVYTAVTTEQASAWLENYDLGALVSLKGIAAGIENTNYFLVTTKGEFVLTLFEILSIEQLPYYLNLMAHLARRGIPCPRPIANRRGAYLDGLNGKPAAIVTRLPGNHIEHPTVAHCAALGALLACMHLAAADFQPVYPNPRGSVWRQAIAPRLRPFLDANNATLLDRELEADRLLSGIDLPAAAIHADLFRDNVLWDGECISGVIDFYFAGHDALLFDVAVAVNDWCLLPDGTLDDTRTIALLDAYRALRPFTPRERKAWPLQLRAGALRFWLSRLYDHHLPRPGVLTHAKDPGHFRRVLEQHAVNETALNQLFPK